MFPLLFTVCDENIEICLNPIQLYVLFFVPQTVDLTTINLFDF